MEKQYTVGEGFKLQSYLVACRAVGLNFRGLIASEGDALVNGDTKLSDGTLTVRIAEAAAEGEEAPAMTLAEAIELSDISVAANLG